MLSVGRKKKSTLRAENTGLGSKIKIVIWCSCFIVCLAVPHSVPSPLRCSPHRCFRVEASGVLPVVHHKFPSPQQEQQLEYFSEAASAPRYICYFGRAGQVTAYLKVL